MKNLSLAVLLSSLALAAAAAPSESLIRAVIQVESGGDTRAVGDKGRAVGCMQIWKAVVDDVNAVSKVKYTYADRYSMEKSAEMFKIYIRRYATVKRLGRIPTDEDMARIWNGGPNGYKRASTVQYWRKVKAAMDLK